MNLLLNQLKSKSYNSFFLQTASGQFQTCIECWELTVGSELLDAGSTPKVEVELRQKEGC